MAEPGLADAVGESTKRLQAGDWVEVLSKDAILGALDRGGRLDGLPFMPQMFAFCGQRFRVFKRAHKTCDTVNLTGGRHIEDAVHLEGLRCDGKAYGGCQAECLIFWKTSWLRKVDGPSGTNPVQLRPRRLPMAGGCSEADVMRGTRNAQSTDADTVYSCQATELPAATSLLPWWDLRQYFEDYTSGNEAPSTLLGGAAYVTVFNALRAARRVGARDALIRFYDRVQATRGGVPFPRKQGRVPDGEKTPNGKLDLKPGEFVRVKSHEAILNTLDSQCKNRGLYFDAEEVPYCGNVYRVRSRVERIVDERTGRMIPIKGGTVILDDVWCKGHYSDRRMFCPRAIYPFWRETWLERAEPGAEPTQAKPHVVSGGPLPTMTEQQSFWDGWNREWRFGDLDFFMERQRQVAFECAQRAELRGARLLDAGCGTGWLGAALTSFGEVTATDLSAASIEQGRKRYPEVKLLSGDFMKLDLEPGFDFVVSADSLAHMYDQAAFVRRIAELLVPGGTFLVMTQNPFVWERRSTAFAVETGQIQRWPSLREIRSLLARDFEIERISSLDPGGDKGVLFWVENRIIRGGMRRLVGRQRWDSALEAVRLGRELVVVARRKSG